MTISIIIPTFNRKNLLKTVLLSLEKQKVRNIELFIVVVDDGSTDGTSQMIKTDYPEIKVLMGTGNWWYTKSINEGMKYSQRFNPDYILTLNDDIEIDNNYLETLINEIRLVEPDSIINSIAVTKDHSVKRSEKISQELTDNKYITVTFAGAKEYIRWNGRLKRYIKPFTSVKKEILEGIYPTFVVSGRGLLIPNNILVRLNFFDERFPQYGSDDDFGLRAIRAGYNCYISWNAKIYENIKYTSKGNAYRQEGFLIFIKSFFNKYSINSLNKTFYLALRHGYKILLPVRILLFIFGTTRTYMFKYHK